MGMVLIMFLLTANGAAQQAISGRVLDPASAPVAGVRIQAACPTQSRQMVTDSSGAFAVMCPTFAANVLLHMTAAGFAPRDVTAHPASFVTVTLQFATSEQVTVTATRSASPFGATAKTMYTLSREELHDYPAPVLDDTLRQHAGFELFRRSSSRTQNPTSQGISLRGLGSTAVSRTLVLEDGAPLSDPFGGWIHWNEAPAASIDSITLATGGGSDLYGSSALGGVIDVTPSAIAPSFFTFRALGGSQNTSNVEARVDHGYVTLSGDSLHTGGYIVTTPASAGSVDTPANVHSQSLHTELGRRVAATKRFFATGNVFNEARNNGTPVTTNATRLWRYLGGYDSPDGGPVPFRARVFGSQEGYRQSFSSIGANRNSEMLTRLQRVRTQEVGATADATFHGKLIALVTGADLRDIRALDTETPYLRGAASGLFNVSARQRFLGGFAEVLAQRGPWSGAASMRIDAARNLDNRTVTNSLTGSTPTTYPNRTEIVPSPRLGLVRTFGPRVTVHASAFRAFRTPTFNELYRTGQVGQETTLPNAALLSERATGVEAGTQFSLADHTVQATYFWTEINRPVSAVLLTQTATTITNQRQNLGQIQSRGVEVAANLYRTRSISASFGYQYALATVTSFKAQPTLVGNSIPQVPRQSGTAQVRAHERRLGEITLAARASGMVYDDAANTFILRRFISLDLSVSHPLTRNLEAFGLVQNLTNQRPDVSRTPVLTLGSPIFAEAGLRLTLGHPR